MEENIQVEEGISLMDIIRLLLGRIKLLILVVLIGGILGGALAVFRTYDVNYYGTSMEFYVNPEKPKENTGGSESQYGVYGAYGRHVMDNMVKLLDSESFTEKLILNGLPLPLIPGSEDVDKNAANTVSEKNIDEEITLVDGTKTSLRVLITDAQSKINDWNAKSKTLANKNIEKSETTEALSKKTVYLNTLWHELYLNDFVVTSSFNEKEYATNIKDSDNSEFIDLITCYNEREVIQVELDEINAEIAVHQPAAVAAQETAETATELALKYWRKTSKYKSELSRFASSVSYSYLQSTEDIEDANNLARSFIYVKISVLNNEEFAKILRERVETVVPDYVEENMTIPADYQGTNCQRITRTDDIVMTNPGYTTNQAVRYGLLMGAAALVIACVIIIILDKSDKRLRDPEIITRKFNVPVLGIVPTIEELVIENNAKKKAQKNKKSEVK